jgi:transposase
MNVTLREPTDKQELDRRIAREKNAKQRDRLRAVAMALQGQDAPRIAQALGRSRRFVQEWVYVYRDGGIDAIRATPQTGQPVKLAREDQARFKARFLAGPTEKDQGLCTLRGRDAQRILKEEFGKKYTLSGVYHLLHRLKLSSLSPRPRHRKNDPAAMEQWVKDAPFLSAKSRRNTRNKK